jgi:phosphocarrier protein FPr
MYRSIGDAFGSLRVVFRTLDAGGDKPMPFAAVPDEANPFLGVRGIRLSLRYRDLFRDQLEALCAVAADVPVSVMYPMVTTVDEVREANALLDEACGGQRPANLRIGIMVEVPSVALNAAAFVPHVDFFSIGTNDLIQYAFAADRDNDDVAYLRHPLQPAVLRLLKQMIDAAAHARLPISICGDMASDPSLTWLLLGLGLHDLSMDPHSIPMVKAIIRRSSLADAEALATAALKSASEQETTRLIRDAMGSQFAADLEAFLPAADAQASESGSSPSGR